MLELERHVALAQHSLLTDCMAQIELCEVEADRSASDVTIEQRIVDLVCFSG